MTRDEFNQWKRAYFNAFPDCETWLNKVPDPAATLATWFKCLSRCEYVDVALVTEKIICGELAPVEAYQREHTALHVRAYVGRVVDERNRVRKNAREAQAFAKGKERNRQERGPGAASMFKQIVKFREEGASQGLEGVELNQWASDRLGEWLETNSQLVEVGDAYED